MHLLTATPSTLAATKTILSMEEIIEKLIGNSKSCQFACVEIHNKPIFPFRYETCVSLNINSWELLLKAFILKFHPEVKVLNDDGTTKPFEECLAFVSSQLGKDFIVTRENIEKLYEFRCNIVHFYQDDLSVLIFSLLSKNVLLYYEFLLKFFSIDISLETNLILLPIGFKGPVSPLDFLSNESQIKNSSSAVQQFVKSIEYSTRHIESNNVEDSILLSFKMSLINENRIKNADVIAAITKDKSASSISVENVLQNVMLVNDDTIDGVKKIKIDEETLFKSLYTETHEMVLKKCKTIFSDFKANNHFNRILKGLQNNPVFHKARYLNIDNPKGGYKNYYTKKLYEELCKHYSLKEGQELTT
jgi:hypothetical protein